MCGILILRNKLINISSNTNRATHRGARSTLLYPRVFVSSKLFQFFQRKPWLFSIFCYSLIEQWRSWTFGSRLEFPKESWFALPNRLRSRNQGTLQKNCNAPDFSGAFFYLKTQRSVRYIDAVINFNPNIINSKLKSDYLLFEVKSNTEYNHLGIALDISTGKRYIETFFHHPPDMYITGQTIVKVKKFTLYSPNNQIIVTDSF